MTGGSLSDRLKHGAMPMEQIGLILERICSALDKAHTNSVVHRDIKPANILFDDDRMPYLADFGIARLVDGTQTTTLLDLSRLCFWGHGPVASDTWSG